MAASSKNTRMQSRLEKAARENHNLSVDYEVQAKIIREKESSHFLGQAFSRDCQGQLNIANAPIVLRSFPAVII
jgi:hypothetical protein